MKFIYLFYSTVILSFSSVALAHKTVAQQGTTFTDISLSLNFERQPSIPSEGLYGIAWLDFDNDQDLDLFLPASPGFLNALYQNDNGDFVDIAGVAGVLGGTGSAGAVAADIDNDGCTDLFTIGTGGIGAPSIFGTPHTLYLNQCDGTFVDITATSGIGAPHPAMMAAFGDVDNDGFVDLFITSPGSFATGMTPQALYHNNGDGTFTDISISAGIATSTGGCVVNFIDLDEDGKQDILVGNCNLLTLPPESNPIPGPWELWHNNGDGTFTDIATAAGLNIREGFPMALSLADIDNDGDQDIFATGLGVAFAAVYGLKAEQVLFLNNGDGTFTDATYSHGLGGYEWGWGATFADFDADGDEDLFQVGSMPPMFSVIGPGLASPGRFFLNDGRGVMSKAQSFDLAPDYTSGLAVADFDGNGFVDVVIAKTEHNSISRLGDSFSGDGHPLFLRNEGNTNHAVTIALVGTTSNANGIGAKVEVKTSHTTRTKVVFAGTGFASDNGPWLTFGLGSRRSADVSVTWPSGLVEEFDKIEADQLVFLQEGTGSVDKKKHKRDRKKRKKMKKALAKKHKKMKKLLRKKFKQIKKKLKKKH